MKILYLSPYYWPEEIGSSPYATGLAEYLAAAGHEVQTVAFRPHYPSIEPFGDWQDGARDIETRNGVAISRVAVTERGEGGFKARLANDLRFLRRIVGAALRGTYRRTDVVVAYVPSIFTLYGARAIRLFTGAPLVAVVHDIESGLAHSLGITNSNLLLKLMRLTERSGLNFAQSVVVLTDGMRRELEDVGCTRPIEVISIWGEPEREDPIDAAKVPVLTYSGNFGKKQNIDQLLPLIEWLHRSGNEVRVVLRGGGSERGRIEKEVRERGITNVTFADLVPADQFMATMQGANIHLVPQATNVANYALPSKLFSIMSAGRPFVCIAQEGSPLDHLARDSEAGLCIPPGDDDRLYSEVSALLADPARQQAMGRNGQAFIREKMNRATILDRFERLILDAATRRI